MKKGYIIENYQVINKKDYIPPVKVINQILEQFNGKFLVATPQPEKLQGEPLEVVIVLEFNTTDNARAFYSSEEYLAYKELYKQTTIGWIVLTEEYQKQ